MMSLTLGKVILCVNKLYNTLNNLCERRAEKVRFDRLVDKVYKQHHWRLSLIFALRDVSWHMDEEHDISYLLEKPHKQPEYTLDFGHNYMLSREEQDVELNLSPLSLVLEYSRCSSCLVKLLDAGASVDGWDRTFGFPTSPIGSVLWNLRVALREDEDSELAKTLGTLAKVLLRRGANVQYVFPLNGEKDWCQSAMCGTIVNANSSAMQMLLDNEADYYREDIPLYWTPVFMAIRYNVVNILRLCLDHAEKNHVNISIDAIFKMLTSEIEEGDYWAAGNLIPFESVELILRRGYIPDKTSIHVRSFFCKLFKTDDKYAQTELMMFDLSPMHDKNKIRERPYLCKRLKEELVKAKKLMFMMLDLSPMLLQACRDQLDGESRFSTLIENPPSLQSLCKGAIVSRMGHLYLEKVKQLNQDLTGPTLRLLRSVVEETEYLAKL